MKRIYVIILAVLLTAGGIIVLSRCGKPNDGPGNKTGTVAVDLGLSVKWADRNIGAKSPTDYGDHYAWGETEPKRAYYWENYKFTSERNYCDNTYRSGDFLKSADDVATVKLGDGWRMPTADEMDELVRKCTWERVQRSGVKCYKVTSKVNGNTIYIPFAGYRKGAELYKQNDRGYYWTGDRCSDNKNTCAEYLHIFSIANDRGVFTAFRYRNQGLSVRAVYDPS